MHAEVRTTKRPQSRIVLVKHTEGIRDTGSSRDKTHHETRHVADQVYGHSWGHSWHDAKHSCPDKEKSKRGLSGPASGAASPRPKAPTQPRRNFSLRWAKIPQLPPSSKQLLAKQSGVTFHPASFLLCNQRQPARRSAASWVCPISVWERCGCLKISLGVLIFINKNT